MGWYTNDKFTVDQPQAIVGKWLVGARMAKWTFSTFGQQSLHNLPVLAQLLCATWVGQVTHADNLTQSQNPTQYIINVEGIS